MLDVKLVVVGGATEGDEFRLQLPTILGRAREVGLPLPHPLVSRRHCQLVDRDGQLVVRDLGSTNGTFVGSERVTESVLAHGQLLTIGTVTLRAFYAGHPSPGECTSDVLVAPACGQITETTDQETATINRTDTGHVPTTMHPAHVQRAK